ncbi:unnamed protein product, partial [Closterium sp. NIES-64]
QVVQLCRKAARRPGGSGAQRLGSRAARRQGGSGAGRLGSRAARGQGGSGGRAARRQGGSSVGRLGSRAARLHGCPTAADGAAGPRERTRAGQLQSWRQGRKRAGGEAA